MATTVLVGQYKGAGDEDMVKRVINNTIFTINRCIGNNDNCWHSIAQANFKIDEYTGRNNAHSRRLSKILFSQVLYLHLDIMLLVLF